MAFKFLSFFALVAVARAGVVPALGYAAPAVSYAAPGHYGYGALAAPAYGHAIAKVAAPLAYAAPAKLAYAAPAVAKVAVADEYDPNPQYSFAYDIQDALTGDSKNQHESRNGDVVQGSYSLTDPDGFRRTVDYTSDPHNGFNAVVRREPLGHVKAVVAAPAIAKIAAPLAYAAPAYHAPAYAAYH